MGFYTLLFFAYLVGSRVTMRNKNRYVSNIAIGNVSDYNALVSGVNSSN